MPELCRVLSFSIFSKTMIGDLLEIAKLEVISNKVNMFVTGNCEIAKQTNFIKELVMYSSDDEFLYRYDSDSVEVHYPPPNLTPPSSDDDVDSDDDNSLVIELKDYYRELLARITTRGRMTSPLLSWPTTT